MPVPCHPLEAKSNETNAPIAAKPTLQQHRQARLPDQADDSPEGLPLALMLKYGRDRKGYQRRAGRQENGYRADK
jgi:hypothetical protein